MFTITPMVKNISSTAGSLLDKYNSRDHFFSSSEPASPFLASSGSYSQRVQQEKQEYDLALRQGGSHLLNHHDVYYPSENMSPSPSSSGSQPESEIQDVGHRDQESSQNHLKLAATRPHVPPQKSHESQSGLPKKLAETFKDMAAEQLLEPLSHNNSVGFKGIKLSTRGKRGNRERNLLGIPQSTSASETHPAPHLVQPAITLTVSSVHSPAAADIPSSDRSSWLSTLSAGEDSGAELELDRLPTRDESQVDSAVESEGSSVSTQKAQSGSPAKGSRASPSELEQHQFILDDFGFVDAGPKGTKRRSNTHSVSEVLSVGKKRTISSGEDITKKLKVHDQRNNDKPLAHNTKVVLNGALGWERRPNVPKGLFITGDEYALKVDNSNKIKRRSNVLHRRSLTNIFSTTMTIAKVVSVSANLFAATAVRRLSISRAVNRQWIQVTFQMNGTYPPKSNHRGIFKQLLDNMDFMTPRSFALPAELRTFFRGVDTNSDGEYVDTLDYKPLERTSGSGTHSSLSFAVEDPLQIRDKHGDIRICFHCNMSAYGGRMMISCEHCPLHWHLDCLNPPLASRPPSTRKWMCPNHVDHVMPRRRKRRDVVPVQVDDPLAPNDGDIEIIEEAPLPTNISRVRSTLINDPTGAIFKIPEMSIKLGFLAKCQ
ncbi:hypothetical protein BGZ65_005353, partial [Modicella reniformis]